MVGSSHAAAADLKRASSPKASSLKDMVSVSEAPSRLRSIRAV